MYAIFSLKHSLIYPCVSCGSYTSLQGSDNLPPPLPELHASTYGPVPQPTTWCMPPHMEVPWPLRMSETMDGGLYNGGEHLWAHNNVSLDSRPKIVGVVIIIICTYNCFAPISTTT